MIAIKKHVLEEIEQLNEQQLKEVDGFVKFLKFRSRFTSFPEVDVEQLIKKYHKFDAEDLLLAEEGMADYLKELTKEDAQDNVNYHV